MPKLPEPLFRAGNTVFFAGPRSPLLFLIVAFLGTWKPGARSLPGTNLVVVIAVELVALFAARPRVVAIMRRV